MNEQLIHQIAKEILNETILTNVKFYCLILALTLISSCMAVFLFSYLKKRGESFATKSDFCELLKQLKKTTKTTEQIKSEILTKFSREENKRSILREKLESSIEESYKILSWLEQSRTKALEGNYFDISEGSLEKLETLQMIYFPEFSESINELKSKIIPYQQWVLSLHSEAIDSRASGSSPNFNIAIFPTLYKPVTDALDNYREKLTEEYREIIF